MAGADAIEIGARVHRRIVHRPRREGILPEATNAVVPYSSTVMMIRRVDGCRWEDEDNAAVVVTVWCDEGVVRVDVVDILRRWRVEAD